MPAVADRILVSIAVSRPGGGLEELPGAIRAAERMAAWAQAQGYATVLVHDRKHPEVTVDLLREQIASAIEQVTDQAELQRLVVFFAGHGAAMAVGDQYWILTHWKKRPTEAIKVSSLQRMLEYYGPRQVAIIGDACQEFSAKFIDVVGSPVLDMPEEEQRGYELDQFFAVDAGKQAFMIKPGDGNDAFCVFTEVLLDALEGDAEPPSYELMGDDRCVTSQSLALYLANNVAREAGKYDVLMRPRQVPGFYSDRVYLKLPPAEAQPATAAPPRAGSSRPAPASPASGPSRRAAAKRPATSSRRASATGIAGAGLDFDIDTGLAVPSAPSTSLATRSRRLLKRREKQLHAFEDKVGAAHVRDHFETDCGVCVSGADVASVEASFGHVSAVDGAPNWFRIQLVEDRNPLAWSDTLVTLANGRVCAACVVQGYVASLHVLDKQSLSLFHRPIGAPESENRMAIELLGRVHAGLLEREQVIDAAAYLRHGKHRIITLGCIAAQFYDSIRDIDSLRSMASFYAMHGQPVPLDIVLYGGGRVFEADGRLYADIPETPARQPRTSDEQARAFTHKATPGFDRHPVAGRIPWMRHAWGAVATASCDPGAEPWRRLALAAMDHLAPGVFTNVTPKGREALRALAGIGAR